MKNPSLLNSNKDFIKLLYFLKEAKQIVGRTKFQKLVFLAKQEEGLNIGFDFIKYNYGPYSFEMSKALDALETFGLIKINEEIPTDEESTNQIKTFVFSLTEEGDNTIKDLKIDGDSLNKIKSIINKWNQKTRTEIIKYVYSKYMN